MFSKTTTMAKALNFGPENKAMMTLNLASQNNTLRPLETLQNLTTQPMIFKAALLNTSLI